MALGATENLRVAYWGGNVSVLRRWVQTVGLSGVLVGLCLVFSGCPEPGPTTTQAPPPPPHPSVLPAMENLGEGGPLTSDPAAAARVEQFPQPTGPNAQPWIAGDHVVTDSEALFWIGLAVHAFPELGNSFADLAAGAKCAVNLGVVGVEAYATANYSEAGAILVISHKQAQNLPLDALRCIVGHVLGGGPSAPGPYQPCFTSYMIEDVANGTQDSYYVYVAGTNAIWCSNVAAYHHSLNEQPINLP